MGEADQANTAASFRTTESTAESEIEQHNDFGGYTILYHDACIARNGLSAQVAIHPGACMKQVSRVPLSQVRSPRGLPKYACTSAVR